MPSQRPSGGIQAIIDRDPRFQLLTSEAGTATLRINTSELPRPGLRFAASHAWAELDRDEVLMVFGHRWPGTGVLTAVILVTLPREPVFQVLYDEGNLSFYKDVRAATAPSEAPPPLVDPPPRVTHERASVMQFARTGADADIAFHRISPTDFRRAETTGTASTDGLIYPVLEVMLGLSLLRQLVDRLSELVPPERGAE